MNDLSEKALGEIQDMLTSDLAGVRQQIRSCEGGYFWRADEESARLARLAVLKEVQAELVRMLEESYE